MALIAGGSQCTLELIFPQMSPPFITAGLVHHSHDLAPAVAAQVGLDWGLSYWESGAQAGSRRASAGVQSLSFVLL